MSDFDNDHQLPAIVPSRQQTMSLYRQLMPDREADLMRANCMSGGEWEFGKWLMLNPPSAEVKERLQKRHRDIATNLSHHDHKAIAAAVADVISCYRNFVKKDESAKSVITKYVKELEGIPTWACIRACDAIRHNQAPGISLEFPFNTTQLRALAESYIKRLQDEAREISQIMLGGVLPTPASPEVRAKIAKGLQRLGFQLGRSIERDRNNMLRPMLDRKAKSNERFVLREYERRGIKPQFTSDGTLISPQLLETLNPNSGVRYADRGGDQRIDEAARSIQTSSREDR